MICNKVLIQVLEEREARGDGRLKKKIYGCYKRIKIIGDDMSNIGERWHIQATVNMVYVYSKMIIYCSRMQYRQDWTIPDIPTYENSLHRVDDIVRNAKVLYGKYCREDAN